MRSNRRYWPDILKDMAQRCLGLNGRPTQAQEREFEASMWDAFRMMGFTVKELGHRLPGRRVPDGLAQSRRASFGLILDSKLTGSYAIGTDNRALAEYVRRYDPDFEDVEGFFLIVVSCAFHGQIADGIARIRNDTMQTSLVHVVLLTPEAVGYLIEARLRHPHLAEDFYDQLFRSREGVLDVQYISRFLRRYLQEHPPPPW